jgi:drug/metabolite transporter (DMT)-like permease
MYINLQPVVASTVSIIAGQDTFSWDKPLALIFIIAGVCIVTQTKGEIT